MGGHLLAGYCVLSQTQEIQIPKFVSKWPSVICGTLAALVYLGTTTFKFVYDDVGQIVDNPSIRSWHYLPQYFNSHIWKGVLSSSNYYRPLDLVWFRLNYLFFGLNPAAWHGMVILTHALASICVFRMVARLLGDRRIAAVSSLIFALHPIHVESVAWISGMADPLLAILLCEGVSSYLNFGDSKKTLWLCWSLFLYACATLTKETAVVFPLLILAIECTKANAELAQRKSMERLRRAGIAILPFVGVTLAYLVARGHALHGLALRAPRVTIAEMLRTWPAVLWLYVKHLLLPWGYSLYYDLHPVQRLADADFFVPAALLLLTFAASIAASRWLKLKRDVLIIAAIWFVLPLLPSLYLPALDPAIFGQDRYLYLPSIGFAIFVSAIIFRIPEQQTLRPASRPLQIYATVALAVLLASCTFVQQQYWTSDPALYSRAISIAPDNTHAIYNLAAVLAGKNEFAPAVELFEKDLQLDPNWPQLNCTYGLTLYRMGDYQDALQKLARAAQLDPSLGEAFLYMGMAHLRLGFPQDAAFEIRRAIALNPERRGAHLAMGAVLNAEGDLTGAIAETRIEAGNFPDDPLIHRQLAALEKRAN
jgi:tetratricopeptide (TPR) repeat protein